MGKWMIGSTKNKNHNWSIPLMLMFANEINLYGKLATYSSSSTYMLAYFKRTFELNYAII